MAIKGPYEWRGLNLTEAYVRIVNVQGNPRDGFSAEVCIYSSEEFAKDDLNRYKMLQGQQIPVETRDPVNLFESVYQQLKAKPEFANFVDC